MPPSASPTIVLAGGGTGGSLTPLLAVASALRRHDARTRCFFLCTTAAIDARLLQASGWAFQAIPAGKLRRYADWRNVTDVGRIIAGFAQARACLRRERAAAVVTAGSFVGVPVAWAAWTRHIPVLVHQQDLTLGLANRLCAPVARRLTVAFSELRDIFGTRSARVTGNPIRPELFSGQRDRGLHAFGFSTERPTLLCLGGGTGARALNALFLQAIEPLRLRVQVVHSTGEGKSVPAANNEHYRALPFLSAELPDALAMADIVVTRAGLGTLSELSALGKTAIIVPIPESHQEANARFWTAAGAAVAVDQAAGPMPLRAAITELLADPGRRQTLGTRASTLIPRDAADALAQEIRSMLLV